MIIVNSNFSFAFEGLAVFGWIVAAFCCCSVLWGEYYGDSDAWAKISYIVYHDMYGFAVAWIIFACSTGYGGQIHLQPLCFCAKILRFSYSACLSKVRPPFSASVAITEITLGIMWESIDNLCLLYKVGKFYRMSPKLLQRD